MDRFVSVAKGGQKEWYQFKYDKLPNFCGNYGLIGHWHMKNQTNAPRVAVYFV